MRLTMEQHDHLESRLPEQDGGDELTLKRIEEALRGLRFGTITVVVQDGVVVQIDRTDRYRLVSPGRKTT
jgi:hypothetical protein